MNRIKNLFTVFNFVMLLSQIYLSHESYFESRSLVLRQKFTAAHTHFSDRALVIAYKEKSTKWFIIYFHGISANFKYIYVAQPERSWNVGYRWSRVFLPGASECTGGFFTQLLFHNPHSFSLIEAINSIAFF